MQILMGTWCICSYIWNGLIQRLLKEWVRILGQILGPETFDQQSGLFLAVILAEIPQLN